MTTQLSLDLGLARALESGAHSDVLLCCTDGTTFKAHEVILSVRSDFFSKALKPNTFKEGKENRIDLVIGDAATIKLMIDYIYTSTYEDTNFSEGTLTCHAKMFEVADFYTIPDLKCIALTNLKAAILKLWPVQEFITAIRFIYANLSHEESIKSYIITCLIQDSALLLDDLAFGQVLSDVPELGKDLTLEMLPSARRAILLDRMLSRLRLQCSNCRERFVIEIEFAKPMCPYCGCDRHRRVDEDED